MSSLQLQASQLHQTRSWSPFFSALTLAIVLLSSVSASAVNSIATPTTNANYTAYPPFINQTVPPLVMLAMSKDHRMFIKGYNDMQDLDRNTTTGVSGIETTYADYIDYYGYFDPAKCYTYNSSTSRFEPASLAAAAGSFRYTCSGQWSGNFLNWGTMSRMDLIRKVLYGGKRGYDQSGSSTSITTLQRTWLPQDAHSFAKAYQNATGRPTVAQLTPKSWTQITLCNTNTAQWDTQPVGRVLTAQGYFPLAASTDGLQCVKQYDTSGTYTVVDTLNVEVKVCDPNWLEANCDQYQSGSAVWYKPTGIMQRMGLNRQGTPATSTDDKVTMKFALISGSYGAHIEGGILRSKIVDLNSEIDPNLGTVKSTSKIIQSLNAFMIRQYNQSSHWYDGDGGTSGDCHNTASGSASSGNLYAPSPSNDSTCISWGNPMGEIFYETLRYFMGKGTPTTTFQASTPDNGYSTSSPTATKPLLPVDSWDDPYGTCPSCSKPFVLTFSDAFPSFDSDHLPGSNWPATISPNDLSTLDVTALMAPIQAQDGQSSVFIGSYKNGATTVNDQACTPKLGSFSSIRGLCPEEPTKQGSYYLAGLAHYAKLGKQYGVGTPGTGDLRPTIAGQQTLTTYSVVTNSPFPTLEYLINNKKVQLIPIFHDDCPVSSSQTYKQIPAASGCTASTSPAYHIGSSDGSKGELVDFQICDSNDESTNGYEYCYDVHWDDAEFGWDVDLDVHYRLYVDINPTASLPCATTPRPAGCNSTSGSGTAPTIDSIRVKTKGLYANAGHTDFAGYLINGVSNVIPSSGSPSAEGEYYLLRCGGAAGGTDCDTYDINNSSTSDGMGNSVAVKDFTVTGSTTDVLKDPFWYAAKYGGFTDQNNNELPDNGSTTAPGPCTQTPGSSCEWDQDLDGVPDNYFYAANPLQLEPRLAAAFAAILNRASSGTAASVLASSTTGEGALYQSYFFPVLYDNQKEIKYTGYTQALFVDAYGNLREDTNGDGRLIYTDDRILISRYDSNQTATVADLYVDTNGDGQADGPAISTNVNLQSLKPIWEAGRRLALLPDASRKLLTWIDPNNNNIVDTGEQIAFDTAGTHTTDLAPYLNTDTAYTATKLIPFIRGCDPLAPASACSANSNFRNRTLTTINDSGTAIRTVWKLGDPVYATPVIIGTPRERFDVLYGDTGYSAFFKLYKSRRQVAYVGANDGILHAFNVGLYHPGDDPTTTGTNQIEHGWFTDGPALADGRTLKRGDELWGFIPQAALPHLRWLADPAYTHTYYVDLKPKITDVRIFCQAASGSSVPAGPPTGSCLTGQAGVTHPGGWGTILIGGMRMGGSCGHCATTGNGAPMVVKDDFNGNGNSTDADDTRTFYSSYFVLDVTDPDHDPVLLWTFSHQDLGFATSFPAVMRVKGAGNKTDLTGEQWFAVFGSGPTSYDGSAGQDARLFIVNLAQGPTGASGTGPVTANNLTTVVDATALTANGSFRAFMGDLVSVDRNLDFRDDAIFAGQVINDTRGGTIKPWRGLLIRLTTGCLAGSTTCQTDPTHWGIPGSGTLSVPTQVLDQFADGAAVLQTLGPVATAPAVVVDQQNHLWLFAGTGRYYSASGAPSDQTDTATQYLVGVKDRLFNNTCAGETSMTACLAPQPSGPTKVLVDMSSAVVCLKGSAGCSSSTQVSQVTQLGGSGSGSYPDLINFIQSQDGWFAKLGQSPSLVGERMFATPVVLGGLVLYPTFVPSANTCVAAGTSYLYALYYLTGGPYSDPVFPAGPGDTQIAGRTSLGEGLATTIAPHLGAQGTNQVGGGSQSGLIGCSQSSTGALGCVQLNPTDRIASRYLSWRDQRD